jgi:hypothetical protein
MTAKQGTLNREIMCIIFNVFDQLRSLEKDRARNQKELENTLFYPMCNESSKPYEAQSS